MLLQPVNHSRVFGGLWFIAQKSDNHSRVFGGCYCTPSITVECLEGLIAPRQFTVRCLEGVIAPRLSQSGVITLTYRSTHSLVRNVLGTNECVPIWSWRQRVKLVAFAHYERSERQWPSLIMYQYWYIVQYKKNCEAENKIKASNIKIKIQCVFERTITLCPPSTSTRVDWQQSFVSFPLHTDVDGVKFTDHRHNWQIQELIPLCVDVSICRFRAGRLIVICYLPHSNNSRDILYQGSPCTFSSHIMLDIFGTKYWWHIVIGYHKIFMAHPIGWHEIFLARCDWLARININIFLRTFLRLKTIKKVIN